MALRFLGCVGLLIAMPSKYSSSVDYDIFYFKAVV